MEEAEREGGSMRLRKECPHGRYEEHPCIDGKWVSQLRLMKISDDERSLLTVCPGGEFLTEDALVIEKVDGEWPQSALNLNIEDEDDDLVWLSSQDMCFILDALTVREGAE